MIEPKLEGLYIKCIKILSYSLGSQAREKTT